MSANQLCYFKVFNTAMVTEVAFNSTTLSPPQVSLGHKTKWDEERIGRVVGTSGDISKEPKN